MPRHAAAPTENLLATADAAKILDLSPDMVRLLAREGRLPAAAASVRGVRMFRREDVEALAAERAGHRAHHHIVQFYENPAFLDRVVANFLAEGLKLGGPVVVFATQERREAVLEQLASLGHDVERARASGNLTVLDARDTLNRFMVDGAPDPKRFRKHLGHLIDQSRARRARLRVYGEMVDVLCRDGLVDAAYRFERLWNELAHESRISRLCAYSLERFCRGDDVLLFERICALHTQVIPTERYVDSSHEQDRLRRVAVLEQQARALQFEMELRKRAEHDLRDLKSAAARGCSAPTQTGEG
jgi:DNA-binding transcriptional MerR regulator